MDALHAFLKENPHQHIIWDWNGTLLDDFEICVDIVSSIAQKQGLGPVSKQQYRDAFQFPITNFYLQLGFNFEKTPFKILAVEFIQAYQAKVLECSLFNKVDSFLNTTKQQGISHSVLSAAAETDLKQLLSHHKI